MPLPSYTPEITQVRGLKGFWWQAWNGGRQKHATFVVLLKAEQFIIKNKNIKQERGKKVHQFHKLVFAAIWSLKRFQHRENDLLSFEILPFNLTPLVTVFIFYFIFLPYGVNIELLCLKTEITTVVIKRLFKGGSKCQFCKVLLPLFLFSSQTKFWLSWVQFMIWVSYCQSKVRFTSLKKVRLCSCR